MTKRYYKDTALPLMKRGFEVIPITHGKKFPEGINWKNIPQTEASYKEMLKQFGDNAGLGVITSNHLLAIDIDVLDPHAARELIQYVRSMLSTDKIMVRRGMKPKALIPCYVSSNIGKIVSSVWRSEKYGRMQIELLNNSKDGYRQFVEYGDYPVNDLVVFGDNIGTGGKSRDRSDDRRTKYLIRSDIKREAVS